MAIGDVTKLKLGQSALNTTNVTLYTNTSASFTSQVTEIIFVNTNTTTARTITVYAHGTATANIIMTFKVEANSTILAENQKIVLSGTETLVAKQDTGTDVIVTCYGIREQIA